MTYPQTKFRTHCTGTFQLKSEKDNRILCNTCARSLAQNGTYAYKECKRSAAACDTAIRAGKSGDDKLIKAAIQSDIYLIKLKTKDASIDIQARADKTIQTLVNHGRVYGRTTHNLEGYY